MTKLEDVFQAESLTLLHNDGIVHNSCADDRKMYVHRIWKSLILNEARSLNSEDPENQTPTNETNTS